MGAAFMEVVMGVERPRVALLSNGEEPSKGPEDVVAAHDALAANPGALDFVGNVEGFAIGKAVCDVLVADGFTGNVALKVMEGTSDVLLRSVREAAMSSLRSKVGGLLLKPALRGLRDEIDPEAHGGAVLLGLRHLGVVPHGSFGARGFASAIEVAARGVRDDVLGRTHERLAEAGALRQVAVRGRRYLARSHDPRGSPRADPRATWPTSWRSIRRGSPRPRTSSRTSTPTRSTSTRSCRSSRTPTA